MKVRLIYLSYSSLLNAADKRIAKAISKDDVILCVTISDIVKTPKNNKLPTKLCFNLSCPCNFF